MDVLFVGLGSIGTRHLKNLHAVAAQKDIPVRAWALRSSARALPEETRALLAGEFTSLPEHARYDAAFITNPTHLHFGMLQNLRGKADTLFIEKPIFERTDRALADCLAPGQKAYVAAPMRWCGTMLALKKALPALSVYSARVLCSSYLPAGGRRGLPHRVFRPQGPWAAASPSTSSMNGIIWWSFSGSRKRCIILKGRTAIWRSIRTTFPSI